jgi:hypothetical protein
VTEIPEGLSPIQPETVPTPDALAFGPFVVERTDGQDGSVITDVGFDLVQVNAGGVEWMGDYPHRVVPVNEPVVSDGALHFTQAADGSAYVMRPLTLSDASLVGEPNLAPDSTLDDDAARDLVIKLAEAVWDRRINGEDPVTMGEDNLYLTRNESGDPLALVKMGSGFPTLLRQDNAWRQLRDDEDSLLGASDVPVREDAVTAWDAGELQRLESLLMDDRFSPSDVLGLWAEVGNAEDIKRLLVERSRGRFYERTAEGLWSDARPDPDAATIDLLWSAVGAWDTGELQNLNQAGEFDVNGEVA